jgi:hypothetical protein
MSAAAYDAPSGPHPVGVRDGEVLDTTYPTRRAGEGSGRRLMVRVWYPAAAPGGTPRPYLVGDEVQVVRWSAEANGAPLAWADHLAGVTTYGVAGAATAAGQFPTVVFSHGATSWVSQNTPLMEHLASYGYVVWALTHPGESSGVRHLDGELVRWDDDFQSSFLGFFTRPEYQEKLTGDADRRRAATPLFLDEEGMGPWSRRWVDDVRALLDALGSGGVAGPAAHLVPRCDLDRIGAVGMSFGAAAAVSAAQQDQRIRAVVNLDGGQHLSDLLDTDVRVPLLHLATDIRGQLRLMGIEGVTTRDANEFFFEPHRTAGTRDDVRRLCVADATHVELTDFVLVPAEERAAVLPGGGRVAAQRMIDLVDAFVRGYLDTVLLGRDVGYPERQLAAFAEVTPIDLAPVRMWAAGEEGR